MVYKEETILGIKENIKKIKTEIGKDVDLICVSKTRSIEEINEAYEAEVRDFGENKVQEIMNKFQYFNDVRWHLIGHLQRNKVKYIVGKVYLIHSLDSIRLLEEIEKRFKVEDEIANTLIQINIGKEESKTGILLDDLEELLIACEKCSNVKVKGLMAIIPKGDEQSCRKNFKQIRAIYNDLSNRHYRNTSMEILSLGMSGDYNIAIEEGSNMVRIGEGIFGKRNYVK